MILIFSLKNVEISSTNLCNRPTCHAERENDTIAVHEFARRRNITLGVAFYTEAELFEQVPMVE